MSKYYDIVVIMKRAEKKTLLIELAKRIKTLRKENKLTQIDCYNDTNIHFARIEQGKRDISFTTLFKICQYFNISMEEFFKDNFKELE